MKDESFGIIPFTKEGFKYKFLLVQRTADADIGGHWSFPKGHKEKGESDKDAALREFKEETGLQDIIILDDKDFVEQYFFKKGNDTVYKTVKYFLGFMSSPGEIKIQPEEIRDYRWATFNEARKIITFDEARGVFETAYKYLTSK